MGRVYQELTAGSSIRGKGGALYLTKRMRSYSIAANYNRAFKPADIRGIYPSEIDAGVAYTTARAFVEENGFKKIVVGYDMRLSTPELRLAFITGARASGADVIDIGMVRSPMLYFASGTLDLPGAMITASHSPQEFNGIKLVYKQAVPLTHETGLGAIKKRLKDATFVDAKKPGSLTKRSFRRDYQAFLLKAVNKKRYKDIVVAADIGNGMAGVSMAALDAALPTSFPMLFKKPDGRFPNRGSDPCLSKNQRHLKKHIKDKRADFGIGFDGDGDRIAFLDERGRYVNCAAIGALVAKRLLEREPGAGIVYTNLTSRILEETIKQAGGKALRARVGHTFLKEVMRKHGAVFGAEHSGHFFWRDFFCTDSTMMTLLCVLDCYVNAKQNGQTFSAMMKPFLLYQQTEDVVVEVKDKAAALASIHQVIKKMKPKQLSKFDGYFVDFGDVWGAVKPSVTEFAIKLMFESASKSKAATLQKRLHSELQKIAKKQEAA